MGWNWAVEAARQGHDVVVLTQTCHRRAIEDRLTQGDLPSNLRFDFMMPGWLERFWHAGLKTGFSSLTHHIAHFFWQFAALTHVRRSYIATDFDIVHHITYAGIRHPTHLGRLDIPLVLGPLGGGDCIPRRLRRHVYWAGKLWESFRDLHTGLVRFDPITRRACADALVVYASTPLSRAALPRRYRHKIAVYSQTGTAMRDGVTVKERSPRAPLRMLFAGRLLYLKGMHLGLRACAEARARGADIRLTMAGTGHDEPQWRRLAQSLGIDDIVDWRGWVPHNEMDRLYEEYDVLLFPSLRDSAPCSVLEALTRAMPVICLDIAGPSLFVTDDCGRVVPAMARDEAEVVAGISQAIVELARSPALCKKLSAGAMRRAHDYHWPNHVGSLYADVERRLAGALEIGQTGGAGRGESRPVPAKQVI